MDKPKVAIIVLHWNNFEDTQKCLRSLREITYEPAQILVVDNNSTNNSVTQLAREFSECEFIINQQNYGFSKGNNIGICQALAGGAEYVLLLNNDTVVNAGFLELLVDQMISNPQIGAASGSIYYLDRNGDPTRRIFYAGGRLSMLRGAGIAYREGQIDESTNRDPKQVTYITGCCILISRQAIINVGLLDERFFFGVEDCDYSLRLVKNNYKILYIPDSIIWHYAASSRTVSLREFFNAYVSKCLFMKKHLPKWAWWLWSSIFALYGTMISCLLSWGIHMSKVNAYDEYRILLGPTIRRAIHRVSTGDFEGEA